MKRRGLALGLAAGITLLTGSAAWAAKKKEPAAVKPPAAAKAADTEKPPVSRFSWELRGHLPPNASPVRCRVIRTEQHWTSVRNRLGAGAFPVDFARNMLILCAARQDVADRIEFTKRPEPGQDRLEAVVAIEGIAPKPQPAQDAGQATPPAPPAPMRFHLIETPQYAGPVRVSFKVVGPHDAAAFAPIDLPAADATQTQQAPQAAPQGE